MYWITPDGNYYEGANVAEGSLAVPQRPGPYFEWQGEWVEVGPSKEVQIAHVLETLGRGKDRTLIQQVISFAELVAAPALAVQYGVSIEFAVMGLYARNKTYRYCKDCEEACKAIEESAP